MPQRAMTVHVGIKSCHEAAPARRADGVLHMALVEARALRGQAVEVGRGRERVAVTAHAFGAHLVGVKEDEVHGSGNRLPKRRVCEFLA